MPKDWTPGIWAPSRADNATDAAEQAESDEPGSADNSERANPLSDGSDDRGGAEHLQPNMDSSSSKNAEETQHSNPKVAKGGVASIGQEGVLAGSDPGSLPTLFNFLLPPKYGAVDAAPTLFATSISSAGEHTRGPPDGSKAPAGAHTGGKGEATDAKGKGPGSAQGRKGVRRLLDWRTGVTWPRLDA